MLKIHIKKDPIGKKERRIQPKVWRINHFYYLALLFIWPPFPLNPTLKRFNLCNQFHFCIYDHNIPCSVYCCCCGCCWRLYELLTHLFYFHLIYFVYKKNWNSMLHDIRSLKCGMLNNDIMHVCVSVFMYA